MRAIAPILALAALVAMNVCYLIWTRRLLKEALCAYADFMDWYNVHGYLPVRYSIKGRMLLERLIRAHLRLQRYVYFKFFGDDEFLEWLLDVKYNWPQFDPPPHGLPNGSPLSYRSESCTIFMKTGRLEGDL